MSAFSQILSTSLPELHMSALMASKYIYLFASFLEQSRVTPRHVIAEAISAQLEITRQVSHHRQGTENIFYSRIFFSSVHFEI